MVKKGTIWHAFYAKNRRRPDVAASRLLLLIGIGIALLWFSRFPPASSVSLGWLLLRC
jgi:hypothetical protein